MSQLLALKNEFPIGAYLGGGLVGVGVFLQLSYFNQLTTVVGLILALKAAKAPMPTNAQAAQMWDNQEEYKKTLHKKYADDAK